MEPTDLILVILGFALVLPLVFIVQPYLESGVESLMCGGSISAKITITEKLASNGDIFDPKNYFASKIIKMMPFLCKTLTLQQLNGNDYEKMTMGYVAVNNYNAGNNRVDYTYIDTVARFSINNVNSYTLTKDNPVQFSPENNIILMHPAYVYNGGQNLVYGAVDEIKEISNQAYSCYKKFGADKGDPLLYTGYDSPVSEFYHLGEYECSARKISLTNENNDVAITNGILLSYIFQTTIPGQDKTYLQYFGNAGIAICGYSNSCLVFKEGTTSNDIPLSIKTELQKSSPLYTWKDLGTASLGLSNSIDINNIENTGYSSELFDAVVQDKKLVVYPYTKKICFPISFTQSNLDTFKQEYDSKLMLANPTGLYNGVEKISQIASSFEGGEVYCNYKDSIEDILLTPIDDGLLTTTFIDFIHVVPDLTILGVASAFAVSGVKVGIAGAINPILMIPIAQSEVMQLNAYFSGLAGINSSIIFSPEKLNYCSDTFYFEDGTSKTETPTLLFSPRDMVLICTSEAEDV